MLPAALPLFLCLTSFSPCASPPRRYVAVNNGRNLVYAATDTAIYAYTITPFAIANNNVALVTLTNANRLRGLAAPPLAPPTQTPTPTATPSVTASNSFGATPTNTASGTPTGTPTPTATPSIRGGAVPINAFMLVRVGSAAFPVPSVSDVVAPVTVDVYL